MRLNALHLERYGLFVNHTLDFNSRPMDQPDFHIIYGDNEAGKTTALAAWLGFLFGIRGNSPYGYRHGRSMKVGAGLQDDESAITLFRRRGRKDTLGRDDGTIENEGRLASLLGGLDRTQYELIYSVNDETLEKGGEEIVNSRGDLGRLLFSASAGMAELSGRLAGIERECDRFYRTAGRKTELAAIKSKIRELTEQKQAIEITADTYARIASSVREAEAKLDESQRRHHEKLQEFHAVENRVKALSTYNQLKANRQEQQVIGVLPRPPRNWRTVWDKAKNSYRQARNTCTRLEVEITELENELGELEVDDKALLLGDDIERLETARAAHAAATKDLPKRITECQVLKQDMQSRLERLGVSEGDAENVVPDAKDLSALRDLIKQHSSIRDSLATCADEVDRARERCEDITARLPENPIDPDRLAHLESLLERIERRDPCLEHQAARASLGETDSRITELLGKMAPWSGSLEDLTRLATPPPARIASWQKTLSRLQSKRDDTAEKSAGMAAELAQVEAMLAGTSAGSTVSYQDVAALRSRREQAWSDHRAALTATTAATFETALREHDEVINRYVDDRTREAELGEKRRQRDELKEAVAVHQKYHSTLLGEIDTIVQTVTDVLSPLLPGYAAPDALEALPAWLAARERAIEAGHEAHRLRDRAAALEQEIAGLTDDFGVALQKARLTEAGTIPLDAMIALARKAVKESVRAGEIREQLGQATRDLARRSDAVREAEGRLTAWQTAWHHACQSVVFGQDDPAVEDMHEHLETTQGLARLVEKHQALEHRIHAINTDISHFEAEIRTIAATLGIDATTPPETWRSISRSIRQAQDHARDRHRVRTALDERTEALRDARATLEHSTATISEMGEPYNLAGISELEQALERADRLQQLVEAESALVSSLGDILSTDDVDTSEKELQDIVRSDLEARKTALDRECETLNAICKEHLMAVDRCRRELDGVSGDDDVARLESRIVNLELELEDSAIDHLRRRLGIFAVEAVIRTYTQTHRSDMMDKASEVFRVITGGAYTGLASEFQDAAEVLTATAANGTTKLADDLSKGTRFQLYLALRIAGIHETLKSSPALPFIADDILETFDDNRAGQTLKALEDLARRTQVIYFTHHRHLCAIARETCPAVTVQEISIQ